MVAEMVARLGHSALFADIARNAGVDRTIDVAKEMRYVCELMAGRKPEADKAIAAKLILTIWSGTYYASVL
jgi:hypothetical protein